MRIKTLRLAWFRGAADAVAFDAQGKSWCVYGCNGSGKSSFVDAIEYAIKGGRIEHLVSEYSGRNQENAIPNTHTPIDRDTEFSIVFQDESELNVKIAQNGIPKVVGGEAGGIRHWDYRRIVLRQDEVADFVRSRKGEKYSALLPLFGLHELEVAAENLRQLAKTIEADAKLPQKQGALGEMMLRRRQVFGEESDAAIEEKLAALYKSYCPAGQASSAPTQRAELEAAITGRVSGLTAQSQMHFSLQSLAKLNFASPISVVRTSSAQLAGSLEPLVNERLAVLRSAAALATRLAEGGEIDCPACGQTILAEDFKAHVEAEQERLRNIIAVYQQRNGAANALVDAMKQLKTALQKSELAEWRVYAERSGLKADLAWLGACDPEAFRLSLSEGDLQAIDTHVPPVIALAASSEAPPDVASLSRDKTMVDAAKSVFDARALGAETGAIENLIGFINGVETGARDEVRERSDEVIDKISTDIRDMWTTLHPGEPIENVRLYLPEEDKAIDIALTFHGKAQESPRLTLSEGYRNSLGLCIFLALAKHEGKNDRPLILDDVVVSLDRNHRGMIASLLEQRFGDRQVIIFTHDRDWYAELRHQLDGRRWGFKTLLPYEAPPLGIRWSDRATSFDDARAHLKDRPDSAGNDARKIMDVELALIAEKLRLRLPYLRGEHNDRRMCSDFLERLIADGKKCLQKRSGTDYPCDAAGIEDLIRALKLLLSWANRGSHSLDVVRPEAVKLIDVCEKALEVFRCGECEQPLWMADATTKEWVQCLCGDLRWRYGKG